MNERESILRFGVQSDTNKFPLVAVLRVVGARQEAAVSYRVAGPLGIQVKEGKGSQQGGAPGLAMVWIGG